MILGGACWWKAANLVPWEEQVKVKPMKSFHPGQCFLCYLKSKKTSPHLKSETSWWSKGSTWWYDMCTCQLTLDSVDISWWQYQLSWNSGGVGRCHKPVVGRSGTLGWKNPTPHCLLTLHTQQTQIKEVISFNFLSKPSFNYDMGLNILITKSKLPFVT